MKKINSIYIIDDDPITVFGIQKILQMTLKCKEIETFGHGKSAIDALIQLVENDAEIPDVLFLDINMPIMDGWQFLEEFVQLSIKKRVRVNILTSSIDPIDRKKSEYFQNQTHHLITFNNKPLRKDNLIEITQAA